jgi:hypothetical protein
MGSSASQFKLSRKILLACCSALALAAACGENPELIIKGHQPVDDGAGLGETCGETGDCSSPLLCGPAKTCVAPCGDSADDMCRAEACLPSGFCSVGLGEACSANKPCKEGLTCSSVGRCSVPCQPGATGVCEGGKACRTDATCPTDKDIDLGMGGSGNGVGGESNGTAGASSCIDVDVDFTPQIPTVLLLIDRSGSMTDEKNFDKAVQAAVDDGTYTLGECPMTRYQGRNIPDPNDWRWNVVRDVLMSPTKGIVKPLEDRVRFGLSLYSSQNGSIKPGTGKPVELDPTRACPELINVPIALGNHQAMFDQFKCSDIALDTPTGESLEAARNTLKTFTETGPKLIVLATDGEPDSCSCPNFDNSSRVLDECLLPGAADGVKAAVEKKAEEIHGDGITVHVINVSTPENDTLREHLQRVADAGGGAVYPGFSPGALTEAFEDIINGARSCVIDLDGEIASGKESSGTVTLDGNELTLDDDDGWRVNSPSQIELLGEACETIKQGEHDIDIKFPCDSFKPPVR